MAADRSLVRQFLGTVVAGVAQAGKAVVLGTGKVIDEISITLLKIGGVAVTATGAEINKLAGVTAGTVTASRALVVDANKKLNELDITAPKIGGVAIDATATELNILDLSAAKAITRYAVGAITRAADTNAHDLTIIIPAGAIIEDVFMKVATKEDTGGTKTLKVGIKGGAADAFLNGASVAAVGVIQGSLASGAVTRGASLFEYTGAGSTIPVRTGYYCAAATTLNITFGSNDFAQLAGDIRVKYIEMA